MLQCLHPYRDRLPKTSNENNVNTHRQVSIGDASKIIQRSNLKEGGRNF